MTLGKIERFWSSIWQDFLSRAQFDSFEAAQERIKLWIRYYITIESARNVQAFATDEG